MERKVKEVARYLSSVGIRIYWVRSKIPSTQWGEVSKKNLVCKKLNMSMKNAKFYADFESVSRRKQIIKNVTETWSFFTFNHVRQICLLPIVYVCIFWNLFNGFEISKKFGIFNTFLDIKKCKVILALLQILKPIVPETAQKINKKRILLLCL
jgi:hypothetical protein